MMPFRVDRWFIPIFVLLLALHFFWMIHLRVYPFVDIPYHLAESTIYRYYNDPANEFNRYYSKESKLLPNTFHMLFCASSFFPTVESANRIFFSLYVLLFPISIFLIIRELNGATWYSLLSFLLIHNFNLHWGFAGFVFSIPVFFLFFYLLLRSLARDNFAWGILRSACLFFLFVIHGLTGLFALMFFFLHTFLHHWREFKILAKKILIALPTLLFAFQWWFYERSPGGQWNPESIREYFTGSYLETIQQRASLLVNDNKWLFAEQVGEIVALVLSLFILIPFLYWLRNEWGTIRHRIQAPAGSVYVFLFSALICWCFMPGRIPGQTYVFDRFSVFILLGIILLLGTASTKISRTWKIWIVTGCAVHAFLWSDYYRDFQKENASFTPQFLPDSKDKILCGVIQDKRFRGRNVYQHFPLYYIVWKHGIACARFIDMRYVTLIRRKASEQELPEYSEDIRVFEVSREYHNVRYLLFRPYLGRRRSDELGPFRKLRVSGRWWLYEQPG